MRHSIQVLGLSILTLLGACCPGVQNPLSEPPSPASADDEQRRSPDQLLREEILRDGKADPTAYELVRRLRPNWLRARGRVSLESPEAAYAVVYMNDVMYGGLMTLHQIRPGEIQRMEFIRAMDATIRWGTGHTSGVINVVTGR